MHDGAAAASQTATFFFDDEGTVAQDTIIIEKGILKTGMCDAQAAMALGVKPTGNGRRQATDHKVYTRMTNTFFEPGTDKLGLVESVHYADIGRLIFSRPVISYEALHVLLPYTPGLCSNSRRLVADDNVVVFVNDIWFSHVITPAYYCKFVTIQHIYSCDEIRVM